MRSLTWHPSVEISSLERNIINRIKRANLFVFLRHHRHELFDDAFQKELATLYAPCLHGQPPLPPVQLALATIVLASQNQGFGSRALRAALDSSPLWGAGRSEDTYNLVGHALKKVLRVVADQQSCVRTK